jgi:D-glycero-D-manno-heptose 1,7-bisphosphate phosphatase
MANEMAVIGAHIDAFEYRPDHPDAIVERYRRVSDRRKPAPGMITNLLKRFRVDVANSILIGDQPGDIDAALAAGLRGHLFPGGNLKRFVKPLLAKPKSVI